MKRQRIDLHDVADYNNLHRALYKAAQGKRNRPEVRRFLADTEQQLSQLNRDILVGLLPYGDYRSFTIYDPKKRLIHAACFADRVFRHALMNLAGPVFERAMHHSSYACLPGKGVHLAVDQVQRALRAYPCYGQVDIDGYFAAIGHDLMLQTLMRRFKGQEIRQQFERILRCPPYTSGVGLPIGALTSQYFANYFLDALDRQLAADTRVCTHIRYMDDIVWWCRDKHQVKGVLRDVQYWMQQHRLSLKRQVKIQNSHQGITFCGHRISQGAIRLTRRKKLRYQQRRLYWETLYQQGLIGELTLQNNVNAVQAMVAHYDSDQWCKQNLILYPAPDV